MSTGNHCLFPEVWGGLECTINRIGNKFRDQLLYTGHYSRDNDIEQFAGLGIKALRYPVLWERHQPRRNENIDWRFARQRLDAIRRHGIIPVVGLVHHGSGPAFTHLGDKNFAPLLADYARQVAQQFPWVQYYTPVNEPLTTARFSGLYGHWYPHHRQTASFVIMLLNQLKGVVMAMKAIREVNPAAQLIQTEDLAKVHSTPVLAYQAAFENERRWLTYDLLCGKVDRNHYLWSYLISAGIPEADILYFRDNPCMPGIMGLNYYITSERFLDEHLTPYPVHQHGGNDFHQYADTEMVRAGQPSGAGVLLHEAWQRYQLPLALTEVHLSCTREEQMRWWFDVWQAACKVKAEGVDIRAVTAWSLLGSYDWNSLLAEYKHQYDTGVFTIINNSLRPTATARLIQSIASQGHYTHPLLNSRPWWQKETRFLNRVCANEPMHDSAAAPVLIVVQNSHLHSVYEEVCAVRGISCIILFNAGAENCGHENIQRAMRTYQPWAIITESGNIKLENLHRQSFCYVVNAVPGSGSSLSNLVHASLDLLIDGETGVWHWDKEGLIPREHEMPAQHFEKTLL